ncbi:MAG: accA, partial [Verrucomicrobiales bacterium]|nr:accA [Verrucomicrobiales bacterium]
SFPFPPPDPPFLFSAFLSSPFRRDAMNPTPLEFEKPILDLQAQLEDLLKKSADQSVDMSAEADAIRGKIAELKETTYRNLTAWQRVQIARHPARPYMLDYVGKCFSEFLEVHGDRHTGDDHAMPAGFATIGGRKVLVIGHQKGRDTKENLKRNFGCAHPEGYRKALRLMRLAEKFQLPIISLIDTPGAYPGVQAEERNIAEAIAFNLREMMTLKTPIIAIVIGEGGSGGALGIGVADRVLMLENAYYSVISPEGCAAILWKHRQHAPEAAEALKLTATDLARLGIVDEVIPEPVGGAHYQPDAAAASVKDAILRHLAALQSAKSSNLLRDRYQKFRQFGVVEETAATA